MAPKTLKLPLQCRCGRVRGTAHDVAPSVGFRFVCYCRDCQAFARFLDRPDVLDAAGGTEIFQMPMGRVTLDAGTDAVRCLRFSTHVFRWYSDCCHTPIANTAGPRFPVVALIHAFMGRPEGGLSRDEMLGPRLCRIYDHSATGPLPPDAPPPASFAVSVRRATRILGWWLRGQGRPTAFFDEGTKAPIAAPRQIERDTPAL